MEINSDGIIRADIMTARIEDKNLLTKQGDIYVGTGNYNIINDGEDNKIYTTEGKNIQDVLREDANRQQGLRLGEGTSSSYSNIVELGIGAKIEANGACQIGAGTNNVANSLQFRDKTVVNGNGEIAGDYPLGFTGRVSNINNVTWKNTWHNDIQSKNPKLITDWAFTNITSPTTQSTGEVAFVATYDSSQTGGSPTKTNIGLDGRVYVDLGAHRVYAEGDTVDQAKNLEPITITDSNQIVKGTTPVIKNSCTFKTNQEVVLESGFGGIEKVVIPAKSEGLIVSDGANVVVNYTNEDEYGACYFVSSKLTWVNVPYSATAPSTSFSHYFSVWVPGDRISKTGTYQAHYYTQGMYFDYGVFYWEIGKRTTAIALDFNSNLKTATESILYVGTDGYITLWKKGENNTYTEIDRSMIYYRKID